MATLPVDADGYTEQIRRSIVDRAMAGVRAKNIEPDPEVIALYNHYIAGTNSRAQTSLLMFARLEKIRNQASVRSKLTDQ